MFSSMHNVRVQAFQLIETFKGFNNACDIFNIPIISGNASLFNEGHNSSINPTPIIGAMGIMNNKTKILNKNFLKPGDKIGVIGNFWGTDQGLSGSEFQSFFENETTGDISIDLEFEKQLQFCIRNLVRLGLIKSSHDLSLGGLIVALVLSTEKNHLGVELEKSVPNNWAGALFGEDQSRVIFSYDEKNYNEISNVLNDIQWEQIGTVTEKNINFENIIFESEDLFIRYNKGFSNDL